MNFNFNYKDSNDLNNAKKKITYLLNLKYKDPNTQYVESDDIDVDTKIIKISNNLSTIEGLLLQMISLVRIGTVSNNVHQRRNYFRSATSYITYSQYIHNVIKLFKDINFTFSKIINDIGYIEPENMTIYSENMSNVFDLFNALLAKVTTNGVVDVYNIGTTNPISATEISLLNDLTVEAHDELVQLLEFHKLVRNTYTYKNKNVQIKRNPRETTDDKNTNDLMQHYHNDDDE
jgi:hypothetical protein